MIREYRRHLPHIDAPGTSVFVTWRLAGTIPSGRGFSHETICTGKQFVAYDRTLDGARYGPRYLANPSVAAAVVERLLGAERENLCKLDSFVVMPNHVHVLWTPITSLPRLVRLVKGATARTANQILLREGRFWQREYFDRSVRNEKEHRRICRYIERNPVQAGLCATPEAWRWSSAGRGVSFKAHAG